MDLKDKIIDSREAAHAELQQREEQRKHGEDRLPQPVAEAIQDASRERRTRLLGAIRMILGRERVAIEQLGMPARETRALLALRAAVEGKSAELGQFVYATDRRDLLERALGVLQPDLTHTDDKTARELHAQLADVSRRIGELRHQLTSLEDAQDELLHGHAAAAEIVAAPGDKPKPKPPAKPVDPDAPRPPTTLSGPELPEPGPVPTTLIGPELPEPRPAPTTLTGPELPESPPVPTTLSGSELPEAAPAPSTLGAEDAGAADSPAGASKKPWWRRPFG